MKVERKVTKIKKKVFFKSKCAYKKVKKSENSRKVERKVTKI